MKVNKAILQEDLPSSVKKMGCCGGYRCAYSQETDVIHQHSCFLIECLSMGKGKDSSFINTFCPPLTSTAIDGDAYIHLSW